jgi:chromate reductase
MSRKIAVIVGSLRKGSFSRATAHALAALAPASLELEIVEIGDLPFYNQDLDDGTPPVQWARFREEMAGYDGVIFVTPEYNRSLPAVIKNAIDVGSRPYGAGVLIGKPAGVVSLSVGATGGFGANHHLRQTLVFLNMPTLQQPEAYYGNAGTFFDEEGNLVNEGTKKVMQGFIDAYAAWVEKLLG